MGFHKSVPGAQAQAGEQLVRSVEESLDPDARRLAVEHLPVVRVTNLAQTIETLKSESFWVYGLDAEAKQSLASEKFEEPAVFVLGNESKGIREKTLELCDIPLSIPMHPQCESLNVAASAAVVLYAWSGKHKGALK